MKKTIRYFAVAGTAIATALILLAPSRTATLNAQSENVRALREMLPEMGKMIEVISESWFKSLAVEENAKNLAAFTRNYYLALIDEGFNKEEAMRIVTSVGVPQLPSTQ